MDVSLIKMFAAGGFAGLIAGWLLVVEFPAMRKTFAASLEKVIDAFKVEAAEQRKQNTDQQAKILDAALNRKKD